MSEELKKLCQQILDEDPELCDHHDGTGKAFISPADAAPIATALLARLDAESADDMRNAQAWATLRRVQLELKHGRVGMLDGKEVTYASFLSGDLRTLIDSILTPSAESEQP